MAHHAHGGQQAAQPRDLRLARGDLPAEPALPAANLEPYYTGWNHEINRPGGETPSPDSDRDNYFARAHDVRLGAVGRRSPGHVHGTAAYDVTSTGEPAGWRPYIWDALRYASGGQMQHLQRFVLSEGDRYQQLELASADLVPRRAPDAIDDGLDGWGFMMRTADRSLALLYFERKAVRSAGGRAHARRALPMDVVRHANGTLDRREGASHGSRRRAHGPAVSGRRRSIRAGLGRPADARADLRRSALTGTPAVSRVSAPGLREPRSDSSRSRRRRVPVARSRRSRISRPSSGRTRA